MQQQIAPPNSPHFPSRRKQHQRCPGSVVCCSPCFQVISFQTLLGAVSDVFMRTELTWITCQATSRSKNKHEPEHTHTHDCFSRPSVYSTIILAPDLPAVLRAIGRVDLVQVLGPVAVVAVRHLAKGRVPVLPCGLGPVMVLCAYFF